MKSSLTAQPPKPSAPTVWTPSMDDFLLRLNQLGKSDHFIARRLDTTEEEVSTRTSYLRGEEIKRRAAELVELEEKSQAQFSLPVSVDSQLSPIKFVGICVLLVLLGMLVEQAFFG